MSKPPSTCAYCNDKGWSISWAKCGYRISGHSSLMRKDDKAYQCPYCNKPKDAPLPPDWMFPTKK